MFEWTPEATSECLCEKVQNHIEDLQIDLDQNFRTTLNLIPTLKTPCEVV